MFNTDVSAVNKRLQILNSNLTPLITKRKIINFLKDNGLEYHTYQFYYNLIKPSEYSLFRIRNKKYIY